MKKDLYLKQKKSLASKQDFLLLYLFDWIGSTDFHPFGQTFHSLDACTASLVNCYP